MLDVKLIISNGYGLPKHCAILSVSKDEELAKMYIYNYIDEYVADILLHRPPELDTVLTQDFVDSIDFIIEMIPSEDKNEL